jgi:hypothetical protein
MLTLDALAETFNVTNFFFVVCFKAITYACSNENQRAIKEILTLCDPKNTSIKDLEARVFPASVGFFFTHSKLVILLTEYNLTISMSLDSHIEKVHGKGNQRTNKTGIFCLTQNVQEQEKSPKEA